jgi:RHS repeat-associated protein
LRFPGQYYDEETGLHYNWHRYYKPEWGRYVEVDPSHLPDGEKVFMPPGTPYQPQELNPFLYVRNNPVIFFDFYGLLTNPLPGDLIVTSEFGSDYGGVNIRRHTHRGTDYRAPNGTEVYAVGDGVVIGVGRRHREGNFITIRLNDGTEVQYYHLLDATVKPGDQVKEGELIGHSDATGVNEYGKPVDPHLHIQIKKDGKWVDPKEFLKEAKKIKKCK